MKFAFPNHQSRITNYGDTASPLQRSFAAFDEVEQRTHVGAGFRLFRQLQLGLGQGQAGDVKRAVGALDRGDALGVEAAALQPLAVDAARAAGFVAGDHGERRHVAADQHALAEEGVGADAAELVRSGEAAEDDPVLHGDVAGQGGVVGQHAVVADDTVVGDVDIGQQQVVAADAGDAAAVAGAATGGLVGATTLGTLGLIADIGGGFLGNSNHSVKAAAVGGVRGAVGGGLVGAAIQSPVAGAVLGIAGGVSALVLTGAATNILAK